MDKITTKQDNLKENYFVVKSNVINDGKLCSKTTLVDYRIILVALSKISPVSKSLSVCFKADEFCKLLGLRKDGMYSHIKKSCRNLASRTITYEEGTKGITYPWLSEIEYNESFISITFNTALKKHIMDIKKKGGYTKYFIRNILKLKSIYAIRLYEQLKQYQKIGERKFDTEVLKDKIGARKKTYEQMFSFRNLILKQIKDEINICTDICIDFEEIKENRKVIKIIFYIQGKDDISDFKTARKDMLILKIQKMIFEKTGHIFEAKHLNNVHRNIIIELIEKFYTYKDILIKEPEQFFIFELNQIQEKYDLKLLHKKFKDY